MARPFTDKAGLRLLRGLAKLFQSGAVFEKHVPTIVLVCGGPTDPDKSSLRKSFLEWVARELPELTAIRAEAVYREAYFENPPEALNLADFEAQVAGLSEALVLFPESEGSFAELGLFSEVSKIRRKTLVVNEIGFQSRDSFLNLGPIRTIDGESFLSSTIHIVRHDEGPDFTPLKERFDRVLRDRERRNRRRFRHSDYRKMGYREKLLAAFEIVSLLRLASLDDLKRSVRAVFGMASERELKAILCVLLAVGYVRRDGDFFRPRAGAPSLLEFDGESRERLAAEVSLYYLRSHPELFSMIGRPSGVG